MTPVENTWNYRSRVETALAALRQWKWVLLLDDKDREDECDVIFAAEHIQVRDMALLIRECSGIVCLVITREKADQLKLPMMVQNNESKFSTGFTVSIEAKHNITTWVSAQDRVTTIRAAIATNVQPSDLSFPWHMFPLVAREGGVLERRWHTEGSLELVKLAWLQPFSVLCELMNSDGTMAKSADIQAFSKTHDMPIVSIADIAQYISK